MDFINFLSANGLAVMAVAGPAIVGLVGLVAHLVVIRKADLEKSKLKLEIANLQSQSEKQTAKLTLELEKLEREKVDAKLTGERLSLEVDRLKREATAAQSRILPAAAEEMEKHGVPFAIRLNRKYWSKFLDRGFLTPDVLGMPYDIPDDLDLLLFGVPATPTKLPE